MTENGHIHNVVSMLINVVKIDVEINSIVLTLPNVVNINFEKDKVDLTLFNAVYFNVNIQNVVSTFIWHCPTSRRHITLTTLRQRWKVFWVLTNVAKSLYNFKVYHWKYIYLAEYFLIDAFVSFPRGIDGTISA